MHDGFKPDPNFRLGKQSKRTLYMIQLAPGEIGDERLIGMLDEKHGALVVEMLNEASEARHKMNESCSKDAETDQLELHQHDCALRFRRLSDGREEVLVQIAGGQWWVPWQGGERTDKVEAGPAEEWWLAFDYDEDSKPFAFRDRARAEAEARSISLALGHVRGPYVLASANRSDYPTCGAILKMIDERIATLKGGKAAEMDAEMIHSLENAIGDLDELSHAIRERWLSDTRSDSPEVNPDGSSSDFMNGETSAQRGIVAFLRGEHGGFVNNTDWPDKTIREIGALFAKSIEAGRWRPDVPRAVKP